MTLHTSICDMLGIEYPIFAAGMGGVTMAPLTAAISAAGGCGVLGATFCTPDELRAEIRAVREITDKPFGVDLLIPGDIPEDLSAREVPPFPEFLEDLMPKVEGLKGNPPPPLTIELARAQVDVTLEEKVPLMVSALGTPPWLVEECHTARTKVMSMVGAVRHAKRLEDMGVDIIVAQGMEAPTWVVHWRRDIQKLGNELFKVGKPMDALPIDVRTDRMVGELQELHLLQSLKLVLTDLKHGHLRAREAQRSAEEAATGSA